MQNLKYQIRLSKIHIIGYVRYNIETFLHSYKQATPKDAESFESLLKYLCHDLKSSLSRVRAIYCWIVSQQLSVIDDVKDLPSHESPLGFLYLITQGIKSYSEMFCKMCR